MFIHLLVYCLSSISMFKIMFQNLIMIPIPYTFNRVLSPYQSIHCDPIDDSHFPDPPIFITLWKKIKPT